MSLRQVASLVSDSDDEAEINTDKPQSVAALVATACVKAGRVVKLPVLTELQHCGAVAHALQGTCNLLHNA